MADPVAPSPAAPAPTPASSAATSDAALFGKFTEQHQKAVAAELGGSDAKTPSPKAPSDARGRDAGVAAAGAAAGGAAGVLPGGEDAGAIGDDRGGDADDGTDPAGKADDPPAAAPLSETDAIALLRKAREDGDTDGIDRALKVLMPGSKGLSEFNVDGRRYGELRAVTNKERKKLDAQAADIAAQRQNLERGMATLEQVVRRLEPIEQLVIAAQGDDVDAFIELIEKATNKPLNETVKRHLDKKLSKPGDPEVENLKRELRAEREKREAREREEAEARQRSAHAQRIQQHLVFLDETLSKSQDPRVQALVKSPAGMRAIFEAQQKHYDPRKNATLSPEQAAKYVLDQKAKELEPWQKVLGGSSPGAKATTPADGKQEAITTTPRARSLGSRGAAAASGTGGRSLSDAELFEKYERLAKIAGG